MIRRKLVSPSCSCRLQKHKKQLINLTHRRNQMGKYLETKPNSLESAVLEAVSPAQQAAIAIAKKERGEKPKNEKMECPKCKGEGCDHCDGKGYHESVEEGFSPKEVKMAIGVASDKRYAGGNMTGAVNAIEKIKKGLSKHPQVAAVLKRQNEETELKEKPADLLVLQFRSSSDAARAYKVLTQKVAGNMVPYEDAYDEGDELVIEFPDDADKLMKDMKSKGAPSFKVLEREGYSDFAKTKAEELTAKQKKIDLNKNGKVDGDDLKKLRAKKEEVKEELSLAELAAKHITDMWKESAKVKKEEEDEPKKKGDKQTMTGKPMSNVEVAPHTEEK